MVLKVCGPWPNSLRASPENLLEMQILGPPRPPESDTGLRNLHDSLPGGSDAQ